MPPMALLIIMMSMVLGTFLVTTSSHWLLAWMGLELNTIAILPLMAYRHFPRAVEACTKYFLIQASASALFLFASVTNAWTSGEWDIQQMTHPLPTAMITLALASKVGLAPLHAWLPEVIQGVNLTTGLILSTWQKIAPLTLMLQIQLPYPTLYIFLGTSSVLIGGWAGLNQTQLRKMLAYSSIAHTGWMVLIMQFAPTLAIFNFVTYSAMTSAAFLAFSILGSTSLSSLSTAWTKAPILSSLALLTFLSLAGLPPLMGFTPKLLILKELVMNHLYVISTLSVMSVLLSLFFYVRTVMVMTLTIGPNTIMTSAPWRLKTNKPTLLLALSTSTSILLLPLTPTIIALLTP
uniref:NADH dehydrogenase subunit 2 n=1 Tax=Omobranchus fasciolatoceps TaxID=57835 RepID=UPI001EDDF58B|nr:NADH dehydrogenase subunit 2 [Omobranchus fasciolatoceps]UHY39616.1 NADH dehydrogenase subunit 2 [Omobranchus fasciolatoceps]URH13670.1 NADH dehydrogenase subunit 2 [Omobranchus fasciolatoceps]